MVTDNDTSLWKALADPKRRQIISLLQDRPRTTGDLCSHFDVSRFAVMKHLNVLVESGLVKVKREGRQRWNFLDEALLLQAQAGQFDENGTAVPTIEGETAAVVNSMPALYNNGSPAPPISLALTIAAPARLLFTTLTDDIAAWWPVQTAKAEVVMESRLNGRFYESYGQDGHGSHYGTITHFHPPHELQLVGPFNLVDSLAYSLLCLRLTPLPTNPDGQTRLRLDQQIMTPTSLQQTADYQACWQELLVDYLQPYVEELVLQQT